jgi:serine/threonine protein phosphatase PrpC
MKPEQQQEDGYHTIQKTPARPPRKFTTASRPLAKIGLASDIGKKRELDEDSIVATVIETIYESKARKRLLLLVADGVGGHNKGEVASQLAAQEVGASLCGVLARKVEINERTYYSEMTDAIIRANKVVLDYSKKHPDCEGMGSTIALAVIDGNRLHMASVGDSRVYVVNQESIWQVTKDHSYVQELVDKGELTREAALKHPRRNVITKVVGYYGEVKPDISSLTLDQDDFVLVCCDGLITHVGDVEVQEIVLKHEDPQKACENLIQLANERGGSDNISVIVAPAKLVYV